MTDAEWDALSAYLPTKGRPPRNRRRTWDAIFRVAASTDPWAALPPEFGNPGTALSTLLHAARTGLLERLMIAVSGHPLAPEAMQTLAWRVARAVRRAARQVPAHTLDLARSLGLIDALPFPPEMMPPPPARCPGVPPAPFRPARLPRIARRALRGLPPPRGFAPKPVALPSARPPAPRRSTQAARALSSMRRIKR
jgi:transposase